MKTLFITVLMGLGLLLYKVLPNSIKIRTIACQSQFGPCNKNLQASIDSLGELNLVDIREELKSLFSDNVLVKEYSFQFSFPDKLQINIVENKAIYALKKADQANSLLIDRRGYVLGEQGTTNLPTVETLSDPPKIGEKVGDKTLFALEVIYDVYASYQIQKGEIVDEALVIEFPSGPKVIFPLEGDRQVLLGSLSLILSRLNSDAEKTRIEEVQNVRIIDLRFKNPVLK